MSIFASDTASARLRIVSLSLVLLGTNPMVAAAVDDAKLLWQQPIQITLPAPVRTLITPSKDVALSIAQAAGLENFKTLPLGESVLLEASLNEAQWQQVKGQHCVAGAEPSATGIRCIDAACRQVQADPGSDSDSGSAAGTGTGAANTDATMSVRLVPRAELTEQVWAEPSSSSCSAPIPGLQSTPAGGVPRDLNFQLDFAESKRDSRRDSKHAASNSPQVQSVSADSVSLNQDQLPPDSSHHSLAIAANCRSLQVPLDSLAPARVPNRVVALVAQSAVQAVASRYGYTVLEEHALASTDESLVVMVGVSNSAQLQAGLAADPAVSAAQSEFVYRTAGVEGYVDPLAALTYAPQKLAALQLHPLAQGRGQRIAVIDTGMDQAHPDLVGRVVESIDTTGAGFSADAHGTAVAGVIAATADNNVGGYGIAPQVELIAIKACEPVQANGMGARCKTSTLVRALDAAISRNVKLINLSLTGPPDPLVERYVKLALSSGALVVAAAGNGGPSARPAFPAALSGVLAVTALDSGDRVYAQANRGDYIDLAAPGVDLVTTAPGARYPSVSGTSFAAAAVSAVAALLWEIQPERSAQQLHEDLTRGVRDLGSRGRDALFGGGLLDACAAAGDVCPAEPK